MITVSDKFLNNIQEKILANIRISVDEGLYLYEKASLGYLGILAENAKARKSNNYVYYNKNLHIETTNHCTHQCKFCSYFAKKDSEKWILDKTAILKKIYDTCEFGITEVHIIGGVSDSLSFEFYLDVVKEIKQRFPFIHIKALTATEIAYYAKKANISYRDALIALKNNGLESLPGGGAEIFSDNIRKNICNSKIDSQIWLEIHETAHQLGIFSNATMLYGHVESYRDRLEHMDAIRQLQDKTGGFKTFIPLKFRNKNNELSYLKEQSLIEDLKNYAVCRLFLDNIDHLKAYWPMIGTGVAQLSLAFGVDDLDGTIHNSTVIYTQAGAEEQKPTLTEEQLRQIILDARKTPVERDSKYNILSNKELQSN